MTKKSKWIYLISISIAILIQIAFTIVYAVTDSIWPKVFLWIWSAVVLLINITMMIVQYFANKKERKELFMKNEFTNYQIMRNMIPEWKNFSYIKMTLSYKCLSKDLKKGLKREFRAYWWLRAKYSTYTINVTSSDIDVMGIDLIATKVEALKTGDGFSQIKLKFAVSGPEDHEPHLGCDYKIIVSDYKIYQERVTKC